ncbi:MAG: hypothetical protein M3N50_01735 [Pseudomonadota bacterium]|nr:hypothetical protein [Pseudomonadota bacterium]
MSLRISVLTMTVATVVGSAHAIAAEDASFSKDLMATIALQGKPCDQLANATRNGDSDYTASCKDGNRYHVFVNAQGRVVVQKI